MDALDSASTNIWDHVAHSVIRRLEWKETRINELELWKYNHTCYTCGIIGDTTTITCLNCGKIRSCESCSEYKYQEEYCVNCNFCDRCETYKYSKNEVVSNCDMCWTYICKDCVDVEPIGNCICEKQKPIYACCDGIDDISCDNCKTLYCGHHDVNRKISSCVHCNSELVCYKCMVCSNCNIYLNEYPSL